MRKAAVLAALQVGVILLWAGWNERVLATAPTFRIPLEPVDPYDVLRGRYFVLNPVDRQIRPGPNARLPEAELRRLAGGTTSFHGPALVGFCPDGGLHRVCALAHAPEQADARAAFWSRGRATVQTRLQAWRDGRMVPVPGWQVDIDLGLERFFLPNRAKLPAAEREQGWEVELAHRPGSTPLPKRLFFRGLPVVF